MKNLDLIATRHPGLVEYLREIGIASQETVVVSHATPENVAGKHVCGVLPHNLSCLCASFTEVPLSLPAELRGAELTVEQVRQYAGEPVTYRVERLPDRPTEKVREFSDRMGNRNRECRYAVIHEGRAYGRKEAQEAGLARFEELSYVKDGKWSYSEWRVTTRSAALIVVMSPFDGWSDDLEACLDHIKETNPGATRDECRVFFADQYPRQAARIAELSAIELR
jgi:putative CRISPR-associated protein (TIGR02620 family)